MVSYEWDLGDSTIKTGMIITHTYVELGNFTVTLTVTDDDGLIDTVSMNITVKNSPPIANFTFSPLAPVVGELVTFNGSLSSPEGGVIVGYYWDFGDGANSTGAIVSHAYGYSDTFNVTLTVLDSEGLNDTLVKQVTVYTRNIAIISLTPSTSKAYAGQVVTISVGVRNFGNEPQTFNVTAYYGGDNVTIETKRVSLEPFETTTVVFNWNTSGLVYKISYSLKAEATILPLETDVTDNILVNSTVRINLLGDANNDGVVNIKDATLLGISWLAREGSPSYNEDADFNRDKIINIKDATLLGAHWGERQNQRLWCRMLFRGVDKIIVFFLKAIALFLTFRIMACLNASVSMCQGLRG
ncbi:MAG: PKD domain-containing protein [Candidatus Bathyarchaeia archaeon]|nr:PKD domain-containing protein [Candidatus Bathyarchaeota archaeon]